MGQYWHPVNLDKKQRLDPHKLGSGMKAWEQLASAPGVGAALIVLLMTGAAGGSRGGGDLKGGNPIIGSWAGDRIAFVGDYSEDSDLPSYPKFSEVYADKSFLDITEQVIEVIEQELEGKFHGEGWPTFIPHVKGVVNSLTHGDPRGPFFASDPSAAETAGGAVKQQP